MLYHGSQLFSYKETYGKPFAPDHWLHSHNPIATIIIEGHTAVGLFMVLSGFIFAYGAWDSQIDYWKFIKNRFLRIYPLFVFLIGVGAYLYPNNFNFLGFLQTVLFLANLPGALNLGPLSAMFWAVAVEFQFYLLFPFLMHFFQKSGVKKLFSLLMVFVAFRILALLLGANVRDFSYWTILGRIDQFIIGMLAAKLYMQTKAAYLKLLLLPSIILVLLMTLVFNSLGGWPSLAPWKVIWPTSEGLVWGLFIVSYVSVFTSSSSIVSKLLAKLGEMSFSLYLIHFTVLTILIDKGWYFTWHSTPFKNSLINTCLVLIPLTIVISLFTYNAIERPFLELRVKYLRKPETSLPLKIAS